MDNQGFQTLKRIVQTTDDPQVRKELVDLAILTDKIDRIKNGKDARVGTVIVVITLLVVGYMFLF